MEFFPSFTLQDPERSDLCLVGNVVTGKKTLRYEVWLGHCAAFNHVNCTELKLAGGIIAPDRVALYQR